MTDERFVDYYADASLSPETVARFERVRDLMVTVLGQSRYRNGVLDVADIGCGAGTQTMMWARDGHNVSGIDISEELVELANSRAKNEGLAIYHTVASATDLPWGAGSMDVCLVPELLEHVPDWERCLDEFARILKPSGILFISTTNWLCPIQQEYTLPLYSWYPATVKRYCEKAAVSSHPEWVNHATFPAVNWFSVYELSRELKKRGLDSLDRFDIARLEGRTGVAGGIASLITRISSLRLLAQILTPYSLVVAVKSGS